MSTQTISTKELRENFNQVIEAMDAGQSLLLLYRSKPLAEIKPVKQTKAKTRQFSKKQLKQWITEDKLTKQQQRQIDAIINRLP